MLGEQVGRKVALDIVAHCYDNKQLENMVEALKKIFDSSDAACLSFMGNCLKEDSADYLMELLLDCTDGSSRNHAGDLIEHVLMRLRILEKDLLINE